MLLLVLCVCLRRRHGALRRREHILGGSSGVDWAQLVALDAAVEHLFELLDLHLDLLVLRVQLQGSLHRVDGLVVVLSGLVQQRDVYEHIDLVEVLLSFLSLL